MRSKRSAATARLHGRNQDRHPGQSGHISTGFEERSNLTLRMSCRRYTRLTNAFSKNVENHARTVALLMMHFNFGRIHKSLRITLAMAAGATDHVWSIAEIATLADAAFVVPKTRGAYKNRVRAI